LESTGNCHHNVVKSILKANIKVCKNLSKVLLELSKFFKKKINDPHIKKENKLPGMAKPVNTPDNKVNK
jgi:hypothetical protein